jgi:protein-S-isoprenylcysteine O-methyltransferase
MAAAVAEHWIEASVLGWPKPRGLLVGGLIAAAAGDALRKAAMLTAGASFRHDLARTKRPDHVLVTTGPYAWARHPAYLGFAVWAVSLQAALANPACAAAFAAACLRFFSLRVAAEEALLLRFFGSDYSAYAARTRTWMPGVGGTFC